MLALLLTLVISAGRVAPPVALPVEVITVYHAVPEQTDNTPRVTADGTRIVDGQRIAAVSQELLWYNGGPVRYGDYLWVEIDSELRGLWQVHDTMWAGVTGYVDLLTGPEVYECWVTEGRVPQHDSCSVGLKVYHAWSRNGHK